MDAFSNLWNRLSRINRKDNPSYPPSDQEYPQRSAIASARRRNAHALPEGTVLEFTPFAASQRVTLTLSPLFSGSENQAYQAMVYRGVTDSGESFFVKRFLCVGQDETEGKRLAAERQAQNIVSPWVVPCLGEGYAPDSPEDRFLVYERCDMTLNDYLKRYFATNPSGAAARKRLHQILWDVLMGIYAVNQANLIACDINPRNIMVSLRPQDVHFRQRPRIRLTDFDISLKTQDLAEQDHYGHTFGWSIPLSEEAFLQLPANVKFCHLNILTDLCSFANLILWIFSEDARVGRFTHSRRAKQGNPLPSDSLVVQNRQELLEQICDQYYRANWTGETLYQKLKDGLAQLDSGASDALLEFCARIYGDLYLLFFRERTVAREQYLHWFRSIMECSDGDCCRGEAEFFGALAAGTGDYGCCRLKMDQTVLLLEAPMFLPQRWERCISLPPRWDPAAASSGTCEFEPQLLLTVDGGQQEWVCQARLYPSLNPTLRDPAETRHDMQLGDQPLAFSQPLSLFGKGQYGREFSFSQDGTPRAMRCRSRSPSDAGADPEPAVDLLFLFSWNSCEEIRPFAEGMLWELYQCFLNKDGNKAPLIRQHFLAYRQQDNQMLSGSFSPKFQTGVDAYDAQSAIQRILNALTGYDTAYQPLTLKARHTVVVVLTDRPLPIRYDASLEHPLAIGGEQVPCQLSAPPAEFVQVLMFGDQASPMDPCWESVLSLSRPDGVCLLSSADRESGGAAVSWGHLQAHLLKTVERGR